MTTVQDEEILTTFLREGTDGPLLLLAHGAGAPMDSEFMDRLSQILVSSGIRVWRFEFSYMARRRQDGRRRPPPAAPVLLREWRSAIAAAGEQSLFIGGKSLGGRMASLLVAEETPPPVKGCLCFGYPFRPPAKPDRWRTDHFSALKVPTWVAQGERDTFGNRQRVQAHLSALALPENNPEIEWVSDGDHDLKPPKRSTATWESNLDKVASTAAAFISRHSNAR
jgi:predicted alpha/beta-hydrolase family hydrolase